MTDQELLASFARQNDQGAFAELVRRHVDWVNSMARRLVRDPAMAADVTQAVFILLARKASSLRRQTVISGWLFLVTRHASLKALRAETRRRKHEGRAAMLRQEASVTSESAEWNDLAPILDESIHQLRDADRQAIVLRFFQRQSFPEIGRALSISEEAARKRVDRAVEQLRGNFARRGVTMGTTSLAAAISANAIEPASAAVVAGATAAPATAASATAMMLAQSTAAALSWMTFKPIAVAAVVAILGTISIGVVMQLPADSSRNAAAPATVPANTAVHHGRILTPDEKPLAGAEVYLVHSSERFGNEYRLVVKAKTDQNGRFELPASGSDQIRISVLARAAGYGMTIASFGALGGEPADTIMRPSTSARVRLIDATGKPAAGVRVSIARLQTGRSPSISLFFFPPEMKKEFEQVTNADGEVVFPDMPQGMMTILDVPDERFATIGFDQKMLLAESPVTEGLTVRLLPAGSISGRVAYADGRPAAGLRVGARGIRSGNVLNLGADLGGTATTDAEGKYTIRKLAAADYSVSMNLPPEILTQAAASPLPKVHVVSGADTSEQNITLIPGGIVRGTVRVAGEVKLPASFMIGGVPIAPDGSFEYHTVPGPHQVRIAYATPPGLIGPEPKSRDFVIVEGQAVTADFQYTHDPTPGISGIVVDPDGKPIAGANVTATRPNERLVFGNISAMTDADGKFSIAAVPNGATVEAARELWISADRVVIDDAHRDLRLVMRKGQHATVVVKLLDPDGKPAVGAGATLVQQSGGYGRGIDEKIVGDNGVITFKFLSPSAQYYVTTGNGFSREQTKPFTPAAGKVTEQQITVRRGTSFVGGIVVDEKGDPVPDIEVNLDGNSVDLIGTKTDINGRWRFDGIVPGERFSARTYADNQLSDSVPALAGQDNVVIINNLKPVGTRVP